MNLSGRNTQPSTLLLMYMMLRSSWPFCYAQRNVYFVSLCGAMRNFETNKSGYKTITGLVTIVKKKCPCILENNHLADLILGIYITTHGLMFKLVRKKIYQMIICNIYLISAPKHRLWILVRTVGKSHKF